MKCPVDIKVDDFKLMLDKAASKRLILQRSKKGKGLYWRDFYFQDTKRIGPYKHGDMIIMSIPTKYVILPVKKK